LLYITGKNKHTDTQRAPVGDVARCFAVDTIDTVTDLHPSESSVMQNESIPKKLACVWPEAGQNSF